MNQGRQKAPPTTALHTQACRGGQCHIRGAAAHVHRSDRHIRKYRLVGPMQHVRMHQLATPLAPTSHPEVSAYHMYRPRLSTWVVIRNCAVGEMASPVTGAGVRNQSSNRPATRSHTRTVASMLALMSHRPSGLNATSVIRLPWPGNSRTRRWVSQSYTDNIQSSRTTTSCSTNGSTPSYACHITSDV